jgi:hypothetical protein
MEMIRKGGGPAVGEGLVGNSLGVRDAVWLCRDRRAGFWSVREAGDKRTGKS